MKKAYTLLSIAGGIVLLGVILFFPVHKWARTHVNYITATEDHPLNCASCHLYIQENPFITRLVNRKYLSPFNLVVSPDGKKLYVVAQESNELLVVDADRQKVLKKINVGVMPHSVVLDKNGQKAYVSNQWSDNVMVIDLATDRVTDTLHTGNGPAGITISADDRYLFVANSFSSDISVIDLHTGTEIRRMPSGNNPTGIGISPDGKTVLVTSRRTLLSDYGTPLQTELTHLNTATQMVDEHQNMNSAYLMENVAFTPSSDLALVSLVRPKNYLPTVQVDHGWMMTDGIGIIELKPNGRTVQLLLDEPDAYYADPYDIVITPDGKKAFVTSSGTNCVSALNLDSVRSIINTTPADQLPLLADDLAISSRFVMKRIPTGWDPKGMAVSPDGKELYVAEQLDDRIAVINTDDLKTVSRIDLGGPRHITEYRHGRRLFNNAGRTFQNQYSCYTCHPDEHEDGLIYNMAAKNMGRNLTNTMSLRDVGDTPPYKWTGLNQSIYKQDGMRFSTVLTRTEAFNYNDLDAIVAYIMRGISSPPNLDYNPNGMLTPSERRGKEIFDRTHDFTGRLIPVKDRCVTCHSGPFNTDKKMAYVGTLAASDDSTLFDTPALFNLAFSAPYLHDGRAKSLEEIWTLYGRSEKHGMVNDLTKMQLNDLIDYLKSLRDPHYVNPSAENQQEASSTHE